MSRALTYLRVSSRGQLATDELDPDGYSIPAQKEACRRHCSQALEADVVEEFIDRAASARSADRPELQRLLERAKQGDIDYVVVHKLDRLARNLSDYLEITVSIRKAGTKLASVTESLDDTPQGQFIETIFAANAQLYSANLAAEAKKGLHQKARVGGTPCQAPLGYLNVRKKVNGQEIRTVEVDRERAPHIEWAFTAYASGAYTLDTLQTALTRRGLVTRETATRPAKPLGRSQVARMLAHPYYVGIVRYAGVEYDGRHDPLVDKDTFSRAKAVLTAHNNAKEKDRKHHHYLKGSLICGRCGSRLTFVKARGKLGGIYPYFACIGRVKGTGCGLPYLPADQTEDKVAAKYASVKFEQVGASTAAEWVAHIEEVRDKLHQAIAGMAEQNHRETRRQRRRITGIKDQQRKLLDAYLGDMLPIELLQEKQADLASELAQAEYHLDLAAQDTEKLREALDEALDLAAGCDRAYALADPQTRRQWNQALFDYFKAEPDDIEEAPLTEEFAMLLDRDLPKRLDAAILANGRRERSTQSVSSGWGSNNDPLAEREGFEPSIRF